MECIASIQRSRKGSGSYCFQKSLCKNKPEPQCLWFKQRSMTSSLKLAFFTFYFKHFLHLSIRGLFCFLNFFYFFYHESFLTVLSQGFHFKVLLPVVHVPHLNCCSSASASPSLTSQHPQYTSVLVPETCSATQSSRSFVQPNLPILLQLCGGQTTSLCQTRQTHHHHYRHTHSDTGTDTHARHTTAQWAVVWF